MPRKKKLELRQLRKGWWVLDWNIFFTERKKALIGRDPLTKDLLEKLMLYNPKTGKPTTEETEELRQRIEKKWNVGIVTTWAAQPHLYGSGATRESPNFLLSPVTMRISNNKEVTEEALLIMNRTKGYPVSSLPIEPVEYLHPINPSEGNITIQIGLNLINTNDAKKVKNAVWDIVKEHLRGRKREIPPEPKELNFLYRCRQSTFDNYVRWYDIHTQEKLSFRLIAVVEDTLKKNPQKAEQSLERLKHSKVKWGTPIRGEDRIEKGVKVIYKAIHRDKYSPKTIEPVIEEYNCPHHEKSCSPSCSYYQKWIDRFNRLNPIR